MTDESLALLREDLELLAEHEADLPERVLEYVLRGAAPETLERVTTLSASLEGPGLRTPRWNEDTPRERFFATLTSADPSPLLRLARVYEAIERGARYSPFNHGNLREPLWLWAFLAEARRFTLHSWPHKSRACPALDVVLLEAMLGLAGERADTLVRTAFGLDMRRMNELPLISEVPGFADSVARYRSVVDEILEGKSARTRANALKILDVTRVDPVPFVDILARLAVDNSETVRDGAEVLLRKTPERATPALRRVATSATPNGRLHALRLLTGLGGPGARDFLIERLEAEKAPASREVVQQLVDGLSPDAGEAEMDVVLPELPEVDTAPPLDQVARSAFEQLLNAIDEAHRAVKPGPHSRWTCPTPLTPEGIERALAWIENGSTAGLESPPRLSTLPFSRTRPLQAFLKCPTLHVVHVVRVLRLLGATLSGTDYEKKYGLVQEAADMLTHYRRTRGLPLTLRELASVFDALGLDSDAIGRTILRQSYYRRSSLLEWGEEAVWPYFWERVGMLEPALEPSSEYGRKLERRMALTILGMFPLPPRSLRAPLWDLALGSRKTERVPAFACVRKDPQRRAKLLVALGHRRASVRASAAEWMAAVEEGGAAEVLAQALEGEKDDDVRAALLQGLESLGAPLERYLDRGALLAEAREGLDRRSAEATLPWFPFDGIPDLSWADTRDPVPPEVIRWWLVESVRRGSARPGPLLRRHLMALEPEGRRELGQMVLEAWIAEDLALPTLAEARDKARSLWARYGAKPSEWDIQRRAETLRDKPRGSAVDTRGVLAVAAACAGDAAVPVVARYLKDWYGQRAAQCKALLDMLSCMDSPAATQLLLSVAERFRTQGLQRYARQLAEVLAEERGWGVDELADRSVPDCGFDAGSRLELSYGPRVFQARLSSDGDLILHDPDGKTIRALPAPRAADDAEEAKEARRRLRDGRKELKTVFGVQKQRLYEALVSQRGWRFRDWDAHVNRHPILRVLCQRLVWAHWEGDRLVQTFRPDTDGAPFDREHERVDLPSGGDVRIAHPTLLDPGQCQAWSDHLHESKVIPLFDLFGRPPYRLPASLRGSHEIPDFEGHLLDALRLRGRAEAMGYQSGPFEGHTYFTSYRKTFPRLGLQVVLCFSGTHLNEGNHTVALRGISFTSFDPEARPDFGAPLPLEDIPPVLLSEAWNDMHSLSVMGSGFDADWKKKVGR